MMPKSGECERWGGYVWSSWAMGNLRFPIAKMTFKSMPKYAKSNQQHENKCISDCNCDTIWYINFNNSACLFMIIYVYNRIIYSEFSMNLNEIYRHILVGQYILQYIYIYTPRNQRVGFWSSGFRHLGPSGIFRNSPRQVMGCRFGIGTAVDRLRTAIVESTVRWSLCTSRQPRCGTGEGSTCTFCTTLQRGHKIGRHKDGRWEMDGSDDRERFLGGICEGEISWKVFFECVGESLDWE